MTHPRRPAARLSAAVLGAGLVAPLALAAPALAVEGDGPRWSADHGPMSGYFFQVDADSVTQAHFQTYHGYDPEDLTLLVAPAGADHEPTGEGVPVPFTPVELIDGGVVDVQETRRLLGEAGTGPVVYHVAAGDTLLDMAMVVGADDDLSDERGGELVALVNPQDHSGMYPLSWESEAALAPDVDGLGIRRVMADIERSHVSVVDQPQHGELFTFRNRDDGSLGAWYLPEEDFVGTDTFTVDFHGDHVAGVETFTVTVGEPLPAGVEGLPDAADGAVGGEAIDLDDPTTAAMLAAFQEPAEESAPAEEHAVPEKVETGDEAAWWLAGAAAVGAGVLVAARRRFGLTR